MQNSKYLQVTVEGFWCRFFCLKIYTFKNKISPKPQDFLAQQEKLRAWEVFLISLKLNKQTLYFPYRVWFSSGVLSLISSLHNRA